ncbi:MAG: hypothetical protein AYK19_19030 [Theionarchaea archaeon DG-70-1]|nr:MAG: hypothetical protein AYK19_19030 [Theionarchaea archaeon DG-70-1]
MAVLLLPDVSLVLFFYSSLLFFSKEQIPIITAMIISFLGIISCCKPTTIISYFLIVSMGSELLYFSAFSHAAPFSAIIHLSGFDMYSGQIEDGLNP